MPVKLERSANLCMNAAKGQEVVNSLLDADSAPELSHHVRSVMESLHIGCNVLSNQTRAI